MVVAKVNSLQSLGSFSFKHVEEPIEVFALINEGLEVPKREALQGKVQTPKARPRWILPLGLAAGLSILLWIWLSLNPASSAEVNMLPDQILEERVAVIPFQNNTGLTELDAYGNLGVEGGGFLVNLSVAAQQLQQSVTQSGRGTVSSGASGAMFSGRNLSTGKPTFWYSGM